MSFRSAAVFVLAVTVLAAGCSDAEVDTEDAAATDPGTVASLTIAVPEDVGPLNIFASHEEPLTELVYDKLVAPSPYVDDPQPWLASAVREIDPSTWEVDLRGDVRWHDGELFTADDVLFTFDLFDADEHPPSGRWTHHVSDTPDITAVEALDDDTVRFHCGDPCPDLGDVTLADLPIIPEHVWSAVPPADVKAVTAVPVGTGPYRLVDYDPTTGYRFEANPDYFAGEPLVDELVMPVIEDASATFTALRSGQIDATSRPLSPELIEQFSSGDDIGIIEAAPFQFPELRLNFRRAPFDDTQFRSAMSLALDREELLATVFLGQGRAADKGYPHPDSPWTNPDLSTPSDPTEAERILDRLGFTDTDGDGVREGPDGPLRYTLFAPGGDAVQVRAAELVAEQLTEVGVAVTAQGLDAGSLSERSQSRDYDMVIGSITAHGTADPTQFIMSHRSGYLWEEGRPLPGYDELHEQWRQATTVEDRTELLFEMQRVFNEAPTSIPLYYPDENFAFRPAAYDGWVESPGYGIVHKWSLLPHTVGHEANAIVEADG